MTPERLLTRDRFREAVLARDGNRCVHCGSAGPLDAHHVVERRLFADGGYYLGNGASLCDPTCHTLAESTQLSCDRLRELCGIRRVILPPHLYPDDRYDKWGNAILPDGRRLRGELFADESVQRVLAPVLHLFTRFVKPARTWHLPGSPGKTSDDRVLPDLRAFEGVEVVVTLKYDGEHTVIYGPDGYAHARSTDPLGPDPGRDRVKALAAELGPELPADWRASGENLWRAHSIRYTNLRPHRRWYFALFNLWNPANVCASWDELCEWAEILDLQTPPVLYRGPWDAAAVARLWQPTFEGDEMEGYVVRPAAAFRLADYRRVVGKFVRAGHNRTSHNWRHERPVFNSPRAGAP